MGSTLLFALLCLQSAQATWQTDIEPFVKTISRPVDVYTWEPRSSFNASAGELAPQDSRVWDYMASEAAKFFDAKQPLYYQGPNGVYFATDPWASREWGGSRNSLQSALAYTGWSVTRVTLPVGLRFLDGRMRQPFPQSVVEILQQQKCAAKTMQALLTSKSCWRSYVEIAQAVKASAVSLYFYAMAPASCGLHNSQTTDFIVFNTEALRNFATFVQEIPANDTVREERAFIKEYIQQTRAHFDKKCADAAILPWSTPENKEARFGSLCSYYRTVVQNFSTPWPDLKESTPKFAEQLATKITGCAAAGVYPEDQP